jgi:hypothetical protein
MASTKKTVSVYADDDLLEALEKFKDSGRHKSLNVAIVAILKEKLFGETQSTLQNNVSSTLDIESMINQAIAPLLARLEVIENTRVEPIAIETAIKLASSEETAPANFTQALLHKAVKVAPLMLQKSA